MALKSWLAVLSDRRRKGRSRRPALRGAECFYSLKAQLTTGLKSRECHAPGELSRKNIGYLLAMRDGAEVIVETDDDNRPLEGFWVRRWSDGRRDVVECAGGWFNAPNELLPGGSSIWPRGFPLDVVHGDGTTAILNRDYYAGSFPIHQGLIAGEPDVDAIFRLIGDYPSEPFNAQHSMALLNAWCPFNSQNTTWFKEAFPLMYIPSFCKNAYRMDDIWRSFIAQRIAFENGWGILWGGVTVVQERNPHDLMKDFEQEIPGYLYNRKIVEMLKALPIVPGTDTTTLLRNMDVCYRAMIEAGYIEIREMGVLQAGLTTFCSFQSANAEELATRRDRRGERQNIEEKRS